MREEQIAGPLPCSGPGDLACWNGITVRIDRADREEWTIYRWGEIQNGSVVKTFDEGRARFGELADHIDRLRPTADTAPAPPEWWLQDHRSVGSMAHRPRAVIFHEEFDRQLRYPEYQPVAVCRAVASCNAIKRIETLEQSYADTEFELDVTVTLDPEVSGLAGTVRTALNALVNAVITQPAPPYSDHPLCNHLTFTTKLNDRDCGCVEVAGDDVQRLERMPESGDDSLDAVARTYWVSDSL